MIVLVVNLAGSNAALFSACPLWPWRFTIGPEMALKNGIMYKYVDKDKPFEECPGMFKQIDYRNPANRVTSLRSIREHCLDCNQGKSRLIRECHIYTCSLWPYRLGKNPKTAGDKLYDFPDPKVFETDDPIEATKYAGTVPVA